MSVEAFLKHLVIEDKRPNTVKGYYYHLTLFARWFEQQNGKPMTPQAVTPLDVREYKQSLMQAGFAPSTINGKMGALKNYFEWVRAEGQAVSNPVQKIKPLKPAPLSPKWLTREQTWKLLRVLTEAKQVAQHKQLAYTYRLAVRNLAAVLLMLHAGLRVSELLALRGVDIQLGPRSGRVHVRNGKGGKYRVVPLNVDVRQAVADWLEMRGQDNGYLFEFEGKPLHVRTVQAKLKLLAKQIGMKHLTPHQLRHTFGKNLVDAGVSLDRVARLMGHTSVDTTAIYTMPSEQDLQRAVEQIAWEDQ